MKSVALFALIITSSVSTFAGNLKCTSLFSEVKTKPINEADHIPTKEEILAEIMMDEVDVVFETPENIQRIIKGVDKSTHGFKINDENINVGDIIYINIDKQFHGQLAFESISGIVLGSRIMLDLKDNHSKTFLVIYDETVQDVYHISREMINLEESFLVGHKYNQIKMDAIDIIHDERAPLRDTDDKSIH